VVGKVAVTIGDRVETGLGTENREPRCPRVRGNEVGAGIALQRDLEKMARVKAEDRATVGREIADLRQAVCDTCRRREVRCI
jgi:hypothetical protein